MTNFTQPPAAPAESVAVPSRRFDPQEQFDVKTDTYLTWQAGFRNWLASFRNWCVTMLGEMTQATSQVAQAVLDAAGFAKTASDAAVVAVPAASAASAAALQVDKRYLGAKAVLPVADNQGAPLVSGAVCYYTGVAPSKVMVWSGTEWTTGIASVAGVSSWAGKSGNVAPLFSDLGGRPNSLAGYGVTTLVGLSEGGTGAATADAARANLAVRERLVADRTYHVRKDGNDANTGLENTAVGAFLTIQRALDECRKLDPGVFGITIRVYAGTFSQALSVPALIDGSQGVTIAGNGSGSTFLTAPSGGVVVSTSFRARLHIQDVGISVAGAGVGILTNPNSYVSFSNIAFGACGYHIYAQYSSTINATGNYSITGAATYHIYCVYMATVVINGRTITITGNPAFTTYAVVAYTGLLIMVGNTYVGTATGAKFSASANAVVYTAGENTPGSAGGSVASGGQAV
ncbi:hypothetical protein [Acidovorax sp. BLS4]|uniref:hypothetical protein n=1 Tax=Acidovorax sp. BLS4 TaxID=3273430 RepID=UPI0029429141|nr:hypothetical protein [Paracidovorax avenae]WOI45839.1 hypothetical protein R1Z03_01090 [Paracidovorax avenae]